MDQPARQSARLKGQELRETTAFAHRRDKRRKAAKAAKASRRKNR